MKKTTLNHLSMYQNVLAVVNDHQSSWNQVQGIVSIVDQYQSLLNNLSNKLNVQNTLTKGVKLEKDGFMTAFINSMSNLKKGLSLHAVQTGNHGLRVRNKEPKSTLRVASEERLQVLIIALLEDLDTYESALNNVGISSEQIQKFRDQAALFEEYKNSVRQAIIDRSMETQAIHDLEMQLNQFLKAQLDPCVSLFSESDTNFCKEYKAARKLIGKSGGSKNQSPTA